MTGLGCTFSLISSDERCQMNLPPEPCGAPAKTFHVVKAHGKEPPWLVCRCPDHPIEADRYASAHHYASVQEITQVEAVAWLIHRT